MNEYAYQPLVNGDLRLLTLLPGKHDDQIRIHISHHPFAEARKPKYEALSYVLTINVAAKPDKPAGKFFKGTTPRNPEWNSLLVTQNLEIALRHLRPRTGGRVLWIDAICINQKDLAEKSTEVSRMGDIYESAKIVVIFLGPEADNSTLAIQRMKSLALGAHPDFRTRKYREHLTNLQIVLLHIKRFVHEKITNDLSPDIELQGKLKDECTAINHILNRPWFTRLWVVQEIQLATRAVIVLGCTTIHFDDFLLALEWIGYILLCYPHGPVAKCFHRKTVLDCYGILRYDMKNTDMVIILSRTTNLNCSDPRDRFHAFFKLARWDEVIDYTCSVEETYRKLGLAAIQKDGPNALGLCIFRESKTPSWSPDPSFTSLPKLIIRSVFANAGFGFDQVPAHISQEPDFNKNDHSILLRGVFVDTVRHVTCVCPADAELEDLLGLCSDWEKQVREWLPISCPNDESFSEAFASSLVAEVFKFTRSYMAPEQYISSKDFCKVALRELLGGIDKLSNLQYKLHLQEILPGRAFFVTRKGNMGLSSPSVLLGDRVFVALGKTTPLILRESDAPRPVGDKREYSSSYRVTGGDCYVHGIMNGEALVGPLPPRWHTKEVDMGNGHDSVYMQPGSMPRQEDPRLPHLPQKWTIVYRDLQKNGSVEWVSEEYDKAGKIRRRYFRNSETGEMQRWDPRLHPDALKERGVPIETIRLT